MSEGSSSLRQIPHACWFHKSASSLPQAIDHLESGSLRAGVTGLSCVGNQIHIHVAWQIRLPIPSSFSHCDQAQEDASENCCDGNG